MKAVITITYKNKRMAKSVADAVSPDNVSFPRLLVDTRREASKVITQVRCEMKIETFTSTIDDLLSSISVAERAFSVAVGFKNRFFE